MTDHSINLDAQYLLQLARSLDGADVANSESFDWPRISSRLRVIARHIESLDERAARAETIFISKSNLADEAAKQIHLTEQAEGETLVRRFALGARALPAKAPGKDLSSVNFDDLLGANAPARTNNSKKKGKKR